MTFAKIRAEVFRRLRESSDSPVMWSDVDVDEVINEGYMEISDETEWYEKWQMVDLRPNQPYYDLRSLLRRPYLRLGAAYNTTTSRWLVPGSPVEFDLGDRRWQSRLAEPSSFFVRGSWWLCYWPVQESEVGAIKQYYKALPPALSDDDDEPGFSFNYHYALVEYALAELFAQDAEVDLAWQAWQEYTKYENGVLGRTQDRNQIPLRQLARDETAGE